MNKTDRMMLTVIFWWALGSAVGALLGLALAAISMFLRGTT